MEARGLIESFGDKATEQKGGVRSEPGRGGMAGRCTTHVMLGRTRMIVGPRVIYKAETEHVGFFTDQGQTFDCLHQARSVT